MTSRLPILLYHDLESFQVPNEKTNRATKSTVVQYHQFESQLQYLRENGFQAISLHRFFQIKDDSNSLFKKIIITFDDGHYSHYQIAFDLLQKYNFTGTFFIITDRIDQPNYLTSAQIRELANAGMEIGSHGSSHRYLPLLPENRISDELIRSKATLEEMTGYPVHFFAYPGGHYNKKLLIQLRTSGYVGACSCLQGMNSSHTDTFLLRRLEVRRNVSIHNFHNYFNPGAIFYYQFIDKAKQMLKTAIGLNRYSKVRHQLFKFYFFKR